MRKKIAPHRPTAGYSLFEILVALVIFVLIGGIAYGVLTNSTTLLAKNISLNSSNTLVRSALDRVYAEISQANGMPQLINADGSSASGAASAAGIVFDRYLGGPYIVTNPGSTGLPASATSIGLTLATNALASPPIPKANDVISIGGSPARPLVSSSSPAVVSASPPPLLPVTVTLQAKIGQSIPWTTDVKETAFLVHRKAIVVVPVSGRNELRLYNNVETTSQSCDLTTSYVVLNREIGSQAGENTPFSIVTSSGVSLLNIALRVEDQQYNKVLAKKQANEFNTFMKVESRVRPRNFL